MRKTILVAALAMLAACAHNSPTTPTPIPVPVPTPANPTIPNISGLPTSGRFEVVGHLPKELDEGSGLAYSAASNRLYMVNDSGGKNEVFVTDLTGKQLGKLTVLISGKNFTPEDWEAMAWGPCPDIKTTSCLFIGDIGDNDDDRSSVKLLYFPEPQAATAKVEAKQISFTYSDGPRNAEGLAVHPLTGKIYIASKSYNLKTTPQKIYVLDGKVASPVMNIPGVKNEVGALTISPDGKLFAVSESNGKGVIVIFNEKGEFTQIGSKPLGQEEMLEFISPTILLHSTEEAGAELVKITFGNDPAPVPNPTPTPSPDQITYKFPKPGATYQVMSDKDGSYVSQLKNPRKTFVEIEGIGDYSVLKNDITKLKAAGVPIVVCYQSLSTENWRPDYSSFPKAAIGKKMDGWAGENWTDTRPNSPAHAFWDARYKNLATAGCDCVEDDNQVDPGDNATGFPLSKAEAAASVQRRAAAAHAFGMCHFSKNNPSMSAEYAKHSDAVMIEEAGKYNEREDYLPWKAAGKFAGMIEYSSSKCQAYPGFSVQYHSDGDYFSGVNFKECNGAPELVNKLDMALVSPERPSKFTDGRRHGHYSRRLHLENK